MAKKLGGVSVPKPAALKREPLVSMSKLIPKTKSSAGKMPKVKRPK